MDYTVLPSKDPIIQFSKHSEELEKIDYLKRSLI